MKKTMTHPRVVWDGLTYPKVACFGGIMTVRVDVLVATVERLRRIDTTNTMFRRINKETREQLHSTEMLSPKRITALYQSYPPLTT